MTSIIFLLLAGFVVLGPKNLAVFAGKAGSLYARLQSAKGELLADIGSGPEITQAATRAEPRPSAEALAINEDEESAGIAAAIEQLYQESEPSSPTGGK